MNKKQVQAATTEQLQQAVAGLGRDYQTLERKNQVLFTQMVQELGSRQDKQKEVKIR